MRSLVIVSLAILGLTLLGCSPKIYYPSSEREGEIFITVYYNDSHVPFLVECQERGINLQKEYQVVFPGENYSMENKGAWESNCSIRFWSEQANDFVGETMTDLKFSYSSLFNREIRINRLTLNGRSLQLGSVTNHAGEAMDVSDNYENFYILEANQSKTYKVPSGPLTIWCKPVRLRLNSQIKQVVLKIMVDNDPNDNWRLDKVTGEYKPMGWTVDINYFPWR
ncbi:MAG: hypothetical protein Q8O32_00865 [bacterium]|nr:hypothetical protein [bacterium]